MQGATLSSDEGFMPSLENAVATLIKLLIGAALSVWSSLTPTLQTLFWISLLDIASGLIASGKFKNLCSEKAWRGMRRKCLMWILIFAAGLMNKIVNFGFDLSTALGIYFIITETLSIVENCGRAGLTLPVWLRGRLIQLAAQEPKVESDDQPQIAKSAVVASNE